MLDQLRPEMGLTEDALRGLLRERQAISILATGSYVKSLPRRRIARCPRTTKPHPPNARASRMSAALPFSTPQDRWSAIVARNPDAVGAFVYAVRTTGIYCRPDCKARLARQANVVFYDTSGLAEEAGYRACKRCKPSMATSQEEDPLFAKIRHAVFLIEDHASRGHKIALHDLASQVGLSKWHLQRVFTKMRGLSPHQLSNSILSTLEAGADESSSSRQTLTETDSSISSGQQSAAGDLQTQPLPETDVFEAMDWGRTESESAEVDNVLRELFPELYTGTPGWTES